MNRLLKSCCLPLERKRLRHLTVQYRAMVHRRYPYLFDQDLDYFLKGKQNLLTLILLVTILFV